MMRVRPKVGAPWRVAAESLLFGYDPQAIARRRGGHFVVERQVTAIFDQLDITPDARQPSPGARGVTFLRD